MSDKLPIPEIILASSSPRRKLLLQRIGLPFRALVPTAGEDVPNSAECPAAALENARRKALSVISEARGLAILGADTIVDLDGHPFGKPDHPADAARMLALLSGRAHLVHTGIHFTDPQIGLCYDAVETTRVWFRQLGEAEIAAYVAIGEPFDKAGAYGIQERGAMLVERIEGCFFNVMGLPIARLWEIIRRWMVDRGTPLDGW